MDKEFDCSKEMRENLLMETAMCIMEIFCDMHMSQHVNPDKVDQTDSIERLHIFRDWAREFEDVYYGTERYIDDFIDFIDEYATSKIKEQFG